MFSEEEKRERRLLSLKKSSKKRYDSDPEYRKLQVQKHKDKIKKLQIIVDDFKTEKGCCKCGENHPACLDFHHIDKNEKEMAISYICKRGWSIERLFKEIEKCEVICSNCHRKLHYMERIGIEVDLTRTYFQDKRLLKLKQIKELVKDY